MGLPREDVETLTALCTEAGLEEAIDIALVSASMVGDIFGAEAARLGPVLLRGAAQAKPMVAGWARNVTRRSGGASPGLGLGSTQPPADGGPGLARSPPTPCGGGPGEVPSEAIGTTTSVLRASRLLGGFNRSIIKTKMTKTPPPQARGLNRGRRPYTVIAG